VPPTVTSQLEVTTPRCVPALLSKKTVHRQLERESGTQTLAGIEYDIYRNFYMEMFWFLIFVSYRDAPEKIS
jgi:hypothetical protein